MPTRQTTSTDFVYLTKYYSWNSSPIYARNVSGGQAEVEFREIVDDRKVLNGDDCVNHSVNPYTEVWFRSVSGQAVSVSSDFGSCPNRFAFSEDTVDQDTKEKIDTFIKAAREIRLKFEQDTASSKTVS